MYEMGGLMYEIKICAQKRPNNISKHQNNIKYNVCKHRISIKNNIWEH